MILMDLFQVSSLAISCESCYKTFNFLDLVPPYLYTVLVFMGSIFRIFGDKFLLQYLIYCL